MTFRRLFFCPLALFFVAVLPVESCAQTNRAGATYSVSQAVEEARKAGVSDETAIKLLSIGYDNGVEAHAMAGLVRIIGEVGKENLPQEPFVEKIKEGLAKHVSASSIEQVLNQKKANYMFAMSITKNYLKKNGLQQEVTPRDLIGIAESLYGGLSRQDLTRTIEQAPSVPLPRLRRAITLEASLQQVGFDRKLADRIVSTGLEQNFFSSQNRGIAHAIVAGKHKGISDDKIAEAALSVMKSGGTVESFCSQIGVPSSEMVQYVK
jgi:hypothetical protein